MTLDEKPSDKKPILLKHGRDADLEAQANALLAASAGENKRSPARDAEKMAFEAGLTPLEDLRYYDPAGDWGTRDEPSVTIAIAPSGFDHLSPSICAEVGDGNDRARNVELLDRRSLMRHKDDSDGYGSAREEIPLLGINIGPRKICAKCKKPKGYDMFSPHPHTTDRKQSWCKACRR